MQRYLGDLVGRKPTAQPLPSLLCNDDTPKKILEVTQSLEVTHLLATDGADVQLACTLQQLMAPPATTPPHPGMSARPHAELNFPGSRAITIHDVAFAVRLSDQIQSDQM